MGTKGNELKNVMVIQYYMDENLMFQWGALVFVLERVFKREALPRYETRLVRPGVYEKEVETDATEVEMSLTIQMLKHSKSLGDFSQLVDVFIKD